MSITFRRFATSFALGCLLSACSSGSSGVPQPAMNSSPTAVITVSKTSGYGPLTVSFDATMSSDADGTISTYAWDVGDGTTYDQSQVDHTYQSLGTFTASLTITDNDGASSTTDVSITVFAQAAGFYNGSFFSNVTTTFTDVYVHIGSDHRLFAADYVNLISVYSGMISVTDDVATGTLQAEIWDLNFAFPDGSLIGNIDISATVDPQIDIVGTFNGVGDDGVLDIFYIVDASYRPASLEEVAGVWSFSDGLGYTDTMVIDATGEFTETDTDGCIIIGQLTLMDPLLNEYSIEYDLTCPPGINVAGDGLREGLARIEHADVFGSVDDWLVWDITFQEGPLEGLQGGWAVARPPAVAPKVSFQKPAATGHSRFSGTQRRNKVR